MITACLMVAVTVLFCGSALTRHPRPAAEGARILAVSSIPAKSHWNFMSGVLHALTDHGHHVTAFTAFPDGGRQNYTEVDLSGEITPIVKMKIGDVISSMGSHVDFTDFAYDLSRDMCDAMYRNDALGRLMRPDAGFDAVFVEYLASECVARLSDALNVPLVYVVPTPVMSYADGRVLGDVPNPAVVSHILFDGTVPRTLVDRLSNTAMSVFLACLLRYRQWSDSTAADVREPVKPSVMFINAHYITDAPRPLPPSVIPVGGVHLSQPKSIPDVSGFSIVTLMQQISDR